MNESQKYLLDTLIRRIDFYINVINTKASFNIAFNTFVLGAIIIKFQEVMDSFVFPKFVQIVPFILLIIVIGIGVSFTYVFLAIKPFLKSGNIPTTYHSLLFFGSVSEMSIQDFHEQIDILDDEELKKDLIGQGHILAHGLAKKFNHISKSMFFTIYFVLLPIGLLSALKIIEWFFI